MIDNKKTELLVNLVTTVVCTVQAEGGKGASVRGASVWEGLMSGVLMSVPHITLTLTYDITMLRRIVVAAVAAVVVEQFVELITQLIL